MVHNFSVRLFVPEIWPFKVKEAKIQVPLQSQNFRLQLGFKLKETSNTNPSNRVMGLKSKFETPGKTMYFYRKKTEIKDWLEIIKCIHLTT